MQSLIHADIFFFIASISTVVCTVLIAIVLWYVIRAARNLYELSAVLKSNVQESEEFIADMRQRLEQNPVFQFFFPSPRKRKK